MDDPLIAILKYVPPKVSLAASAFLRSTRERSAYVSELRLRAGAPMSITFCGRNICLFDGKPVICTESELMETLQRLCEDSVHTYSETVREGYLTAANGYRVGICGRAGMQGEAVRSVYGVTSLCIRIPHAVRGVCDRLLPYLLDGGGPQSALLYAAPHVGKTTLIRDLAITLSSTPKAHRAAIVDTRGELAVQGAFASCLADVLYGYPRGKGIEIATRTLSPEVIFCDEIGSVDEANDILAAQNSGVPLIATAHAGSVSALLRRPGLRRLYDAGVFRYYIGVSRAEGGSRFSFAILDTECGEEIAV